MASLELLRRLLGSGRDEMRKGLGWIGERYAQLAAENPEFFVTGPKPAASREEIATKYGLPLGITETNIPYYRTPGGPPYDPGKRNIFVPQLRVGGDEPYGYLDVSSGKHALNRTWETALPMEMAQIFEARRDKPFGVLNTMFLDEGSGGGKKVTPAAMDLAALLRAEIIPDASYTNVNQWRAPMNDVGSILRHRRNLTIYPSEKWVPREFSPLEVVGWSPEEQIGARMPVSALRSIAYFQNSPRRAAVRQANVGKSTDLDALRAEGFEPGQLKMGDLTVNSDPQAFADQAAVLRGAGAKAFGESTLRKYALLQRFLEELYGGRKATEINPELLKGLEYAGGGPVRSILGKLARKGRRVQPDVVEELVQPHMQGYARFEYAPFPSGKGYKIIGVRDNGTTQVVSALGLEGPDAERHVRAYVGALNSGGMSNVPISKLPLEDFFK